MQFNRRHVLGGAASASLWLSGCKGTVAYERPSAGSSVLHPRRSGQPPIGIQTYSIREVMEPDTRAALQMLKDVGYDYIETNERDHTRISLEELKAIIADLGFDVPATHMGLETLQADTQKASDIASVLGADYVIIPWTPEEHRTPEGYKALAEQFNAMGEILRANGQSLAYHNHHFEFWDLGSGQSGMDILLGETDPELVKFELDLFWAAFSNVDVPSFLAAHSGRFKLCHIKDMKSAEAQAYGEPDLDFGRIVAETMANVGEGDLPFEDWLQMREVSGIEHFIVEHDRPVAPIRDSVATSLGTVRTYNLL